MGPGWDPGPVGPGQGPKARHAEHTRKLPNACRYPGGAARRGAWGGIHWGGDTPKDLTKPRHTIQSPGILDKASKTLYKSIEY